MELKIGIGFDIHRLTKGKKLVLGGVKFDHPKGLLGHSDGDVLLHALCDALLGGTGLGDIGDYFPDTNYKYKNMDSAFFVKEVLKKLQKIKCKLQGVDAIIFAEEPKLDKKKIRIKNKLAKLLRISRNNVNVKAKTMEGLGPIGAKKAIAAIALATLKSTK
ncbi:2-C-methyl-D-erythritol 2,4-cyclodiphosphate synthase [Planctomycetota bacterium]